MCLGDCSTTYDETSLPASEFPCETILAYWDDLDIDNGTKQGIYFEVQGNHPNRTFVLEYYMTHFEEREQYYQFQVFFFEALFNIVQIKYFEAFDRGSSGAIGVQRK